MKRASLQLSINAIVIMILAIVILGLGLGFVKKQFGAASQQFDVASQEMQQQIIDDLEKSGELVTLKMSNLEVKSGQPKNFYFGIRNTQSTEKYFYVLFVCENYLNSDTSVSQATSDGSCDGSENSIFYKNNDFTWFKTYKGVKIGPGKAKALFAKVQVNSAADTYSIRMYVYACDTSISDPISLMSPTTTQSGCQKYETKDFYLTVK